MSDYVSCPTCHGKGLVPLEEAARIEQHENAFVEQARARGAQDPPSVLPLRGVPVVTLDRCLDVPDIDPDKVAGSVRAALARAGGSSGVDTGAVGPVAVAIRWAGSATYGRLDGLTAGLEGGLAAAPGVPVIVVSQGDVGGLIGLHLREVGRVDNPVVSIDGIELRDFDYVDVGALIPASGAVPVVIKSLVFPVPGSPLGR